MKVRTLDVTTYDKNILRRIVDIVSKEYPKLKIGTFVDIVNTEGNGPIVKTTNGKMRITIEAIQDVDDNKTLPEYSKGMAKTFVSDEENS